MRWNHERIELTGKVAVVTGASRGIGAAIARALAVAGAAVVVNYASSRQAAESVVGEIAHNEGRAIAVRADVSKGADVRRLFAETEAAFGKVDILVNNAAILKFGAIEDVNEEQFHELFNTNVLGSVLMIQEALSYFSAAGGSIINIGSIASARPVRGSVVYAASKGAMATVTRVLAAELGGRRIRVNTLAPGPVETDATWQHFVDSDIEKRLVATTPLGRLGQPEDVARIAVFLASEESGWLTGAWIPAAGGLY